MFERDLHHNGNGNGYGIGNGTGLGNGIGNGGGNGVSPQALATCVWLPSDVRTCLVTVVVEAAPV